MSKGSFFIKAKDEKVITEKGVKVFIMGKILNSAKVTNGLAINVDKKTVEVRLEGEKEDIIEFASELKEEISRKYGNPMLWFTELKINDAVEIARIERVSHAITMEQLDKGIGIQEKILTAQEKIINSLEVMPKAIGKELEGKFDALPKAIGKELEGKFDALPEAIGRELEGKIEKLAKAIKSS